MTLPDASFDPPSALAGLAAQAAHAPAWTAGWVLGWGLVLVGFAAGAALGLGFARPDFLGGYDAFRRRILRLGHVATVALGAVCVALSQLALPASPLSDAAHGCWLVGAASMPAVCFLSGWRAGFRHLFALPVAALAGAAACTLLGGLP